MALHHGTVTMSQESELCPLLSWAGNSLTSPTLLPELHTVDITNLTIM